MPKSRSIRVPIDRGFVSCCDIWYTRLFYVDCRAGGAQRVFEDLCRGFERAGWELGDRSFDSRYIRRRGISWHISILPHLPPPSR